MAEKTIIRNTDVSITESIIDSDGTSIVWANIQSFKVLLKGNFSSTYASVNTDTNGEFTYYIESSFTQVNSFFSVILEVEIVNANFSDGIQNLIQKVYDYTVTG